MENKNYIQGTVVSDVKYELFIDWLKKSHFPTTKLALATFKNTGRGMMAVEDIQAGDVIVQVPKSFLISNNLLHKEYGSHPLSTHQILAFHLVILLVKDTKENKWWKPYLDLLPSHFNTLPVTFPTVLLKHLPKGLAEEVSLQRKKIKEDYQACIRFMKSRPSLLPFLSHVTFKKYEWAWLCVNTRCIHVSTGDKTAKGGDIAMAPLLDFLNHTDEARIESKFNQQTQSFEIKTLIPYRKGEQVFINYGPHDNQSLLKEYGFVLSENGYNFVSLDKEVFDLFPQIEKSSQGRTVKKNILEQYGYYGDYTIKKDEISFRLLNALRLLAIPFNTTGFHQSQLIWYDVIMGIHEIIDNSNEKKMYELLKTICTQAYIEAKEEQLSLNDTSFLEDPSIHPFALLFLKQIWKESIEILEQVLYSVEAKLSILS
ncbi:unnamed protein product [Cunninghamella blakesleeana]